MGALLSLPLMALPSLSTVRHSSRHDHEVFTDSVPRLLGSAQAVAGQLLALQYAVLVGNAGIGSITVLSCLLRLATLTVT